MRAVADVGATDGRAVARSELARAAVRLGCRVPIEQWRCGHVLEYAESVTRSMATDDVAIAFFFFMSYRQRRRLPSRNDCRGVPLVMTVRPTGTRQAKNPLPVPYYCPAFRSVGPPVYGPEQM